MSKWDPDNHGYTWTDLAFGALVVLVLVYSAVMYFTVPYEPEQHGGVSSFPAGGVERGAVAHRPGDRPATHTAGDSSPSGGTTGGEAWLAPSLRAPNHPPGAPRRPFLDELDFLSRRPSRGG